MRTITRVTSRHTTLALLCLASLAPLTACGGSDDGGDPATTAGNGGSSGVSGGAGTGGQAGGGQPGGGQAGGGQAGGGQAGGGQAGASGAAGAGQAGAGQAGQGGAAGQGAAGAAGGQAGQGGQAGASGQGGQGGVYEPITPVPTGALAAGLSHTCAVVEGGDVRCWGTSGSGALGLGLARMLGDDETPASIGDLTLGGKVTQVAKGEAHSCALLEDGTLRCWGDNSWGQLGLGHRRLLGDDEAASAGGAVDVGGKVVQVAAGGGHTCALLDTGNVRCWGYAQGGRLGNSSDEVIGDDETPASAGPVPVGGKVVQLAAASEHTCALLDTGNVRCWGSGYDGRLGHGNTSTLGDDETPASAGDIDLGGKATSIVAHDRRTCAVLTTGGVRCWGSAFSGALGYGLGTVVGDDETPASAGDIDLGGKAVQVTLGDEHTCARLDTGAVRCWGSGIDGQLGYGNEESVGVDDAPGSAGDVDVGGKVVQVAAGGGHTCALLDTGNVRCWGYGWLLGRGATEDIGDDETPASAGDIDLGGKATALAVGGGQTCAVLTTGGVRCWGSPIGRGDGDTRRVGMSVGDDEAPSTHGPAAVGGKARKVSASRRHTCALLDTGAVRCWGAGGLGALGYGSTASIGLADGAASAGDVDLGGKAIDIGTGNDHTCALLDTGRVRCWGSGYDGRLGYGNKNDVGNELKPSSAGDVDVGGKVTQISLGKAHTCALLDAGNVRCWGDNSGHQLGLVDAGDIGDDETPASAGDVDLGGKAVQLASGGNFTCALMAWGGVRCWGENYYGNLGHGDTNEIGDDETPASAGDIDLGGKAVQIVASYGHACALLDTGRVRCWGEGADGALGYGATANIGDDETPASAGDVDLGGKAVQLAAGEGHTCAALDTGRVRCWGKGLDGALGYGDQASIGDDETPASAGDVDLGGKVLPPE